MSLKIKVVIKGTESEQTKTVKIAATGASVEEICRQGNIDMKDKDFTVNGMAAKPGTHVGKNDVLKAESRKTATVEVSARPQGS